MSIINKNGFLSGHTGDLVYREVKGKQIVQAMPSHYHDANTISQQKQRSGLRNIMAFYRLLKDLIKEQFEEASPLKRAYNCFIHHNLLLPAVILEKQAFDQGLCLLAPYVISHGSLPSLQAEIVDGRIRFQMKKDEWKQGDVLRRIQVAPSTHENNCSPLSWTATFTDEAIDTPEDRIIEMGGNASGGYAFIHIRNTANHRWVSTQHLVIL